MNILDAMDAHLFGREAVLAFMADFQAQWNEPMFALAADILNRQPDLVRQMAMMALPPDLARVMEVYHANYIHGHSERPKDELAEANRVQIPNLNEST